jgi:glutamate synthase (NADPH/NADH) small chain
VCPTQVLCEGGCVMNHQSSPPIQIGRLQRHATEHVYAKGLQLFRAAAPNGKRIACVGGGPASLAAAHELALLGYQAVIFEGRALPGGLNTTGVAPYKLKSERSLREVAYILEVGNLELRAGERIDQARLAELARDFDAVFLGIGLGPDSRLGVPGEEAKGVVGAVELIERLKNEDAASLAWVKGLKRAAVVGGGNTAIDVVRELRKLSVPNVTLVYRREEARMSAYAHEVSAARKEGVRFLFELQPVEVVMDGDRRVVGLKVRRTHAAGGAGGRGAAALAEVEGSDTVLPADAVVLAIGQSKLEALCGAVEGLRLDRGRVVVDPATGQTGNPRYFAGGDCANGGKEVVNAAAEGKRAARGIDRWLRGGGEKA